MLDSSAGIRYNVYRKGTATSGWSLSNESSYLSPKNRHLAEWRFLLFTTMLNVIVLRPT